MTTSDEVHQPLSPTAQELITWGLDPSWSRRVSVNSNDGSSVDWHVLDTGPRPRGTIVCVHGNPSWAYLWRDVLTTLSPQWRVIAIDQTNMGYSERTTPRRLEQRVSELVDFCRREVDGPLVLLAHDWGGPVALGASASLDVRALVLFNTGVAKPDGMAVPPLIAAARATSDLTCRRTTAFVGGAARMTDRRHRAALVAPYRTPARRAGIAFFVEDIPVSVADVSYEALGRSAAALDDFDGPVLFVWGGRDPVFGDRFLADLRRRVPRATVQRFRDAGHYVPLDHEVGDVVGRWLDQLGSVRDESASGDPFVSVLETVQRRRDDRSPVYVGPDATLSWRDLEAQSSVAASVLATHGLRRGDHVSLLIAPSAELLVATIAVWRCAGVPVIADASGGLGQLRRLVRAQAPRFVLGTARTLAAASALRLAPGAVRAAFSNVPGALDLRRLGDAVVAPDVAVSPDDVAVVVHTSGSTGPAKPVRYTHRSLAALRGALHSLGLEASGAFTTSFGPFMLLAPMLEMTCVRPDFDVDQPSRLGFDELRDAVSGTSVTGAWLSPAAARHVVATADGRRLAFELVMLAGAPIAPRLAADVALVTGGDVRAPYGMTECLPVSDGTDWSFPGSHGGHCVGRPVPGCEVTIADLDDPLVDVTSTGGWGEILVRAAWMFAGYDADWLKDQASETWVGERRFHRTGDVGYVEDGRLFHLGRLAHVIRTASGPLSSVAVEGPIGERLGRDVCAVGVGPQGSEVVCVVVGGDGRLAVADATVARWVREASTVKVAAVLVGRLPLDHRHQSKIDRSDVRARAVELLAGR